MDEGRFTIIFKTLEEENITGSHNTKYMTELLQTSQEIRKFSEIVNDIKFEEEVKTYTRA